MALTKFELKHGFELIRVSYSKVSTPIKDREYCPLHVNGPVGTIKEWKEFGKEHKLKVLIFFNKKGKRIKTVKI